MTDTPADWVLIEAANAAAPYYQDRIEALSAEVERLREALTHISNQTGHCKTCQTLALTGCTECDCYYPVWEPMDAASFARAAGLERAAVIMEGEAKTLYRIAHMNLPAYSPTVARDRAQYCEGMADAIRAEKDKT